MHQFGQKRQDLAEIDDSPLAEHSQMLMGDKRQQILRST